MQMTTQPRQLKVFDWLVPSVMFIVGVTASVLVPPPTPESKLKMVVETPRNVTVDDHGYLEFHLDGKSGTWSKSDPEYAAIKNAMLSGEPVNAGVSLERQTLFPTPENLTLYKLSVGDTQVLSYKEALEEQDQRRRSLFIFTGALSFLGAIGLLKNFLRSRGTVRANGVASQDESITGITTAVSVIMLMTLLVVNFDGAVHKTQVEAFGATWLGIPMTYVVCLTETILFIPMPFVFWHLSRIIMRAKKDGYSVHRSFQLLIYFLRIQQLHPDLITSQLVCLCGFLYFVVISGVWILYAATKGI